MNESSRQNYPVNPLLNFAEAARRYLYEGGEARFLGPLIAKIGERPLKTIDQNVVDEIAKDLYPRGSAATWNRQIYTPIAAVLHFAKVRRQLNRPKAPVQRRVSLPDPAQIHLLLDAACEVDSEFGRLCKLLWWSNCRLSEALSRGLKDLDSIKGKIKLKNRSASLPADLIRDLAKFSANTKQLFSFRKGGQLYILLQRAAAEAEIKLPPGTGFDVFRSAKP